LANKSIHAHDVFFLIISCHGIATVFIFTSVHLFWIFVINDFTCTLVKTVFILVTYAM
jgi:hypothetical protein